MLSSGQALLSIFVQHLWVPALHSIFVAPLQERGAQEEATWRRQVGAGGEGREQDGLHRKKPQQEGTRGGIQSSHHLHKGTYVQEDDL